MMSTQISVDIPRNVPAAARAESVILQFVPPRVRDDAEPAASSQTFGVTTSEAKAEKPDERAAPTENISLLEGFAQEFEMQARKVVFHVSVETGDLLIQVVDGETGDIVRQIPPDEVIAFMRRFREVLGLLLDEKI